jgi:hypothetical protein
MSDRTEHTHVLGHELESLDAGQGLVDCRSSYRSRRIQSYEQES